MLVNVCNALSYALMKPWFPEPQKEVEIPSPTPSTSSKKGKGAKDTKPKLSTTQVSISADAMPDLKKAIEV